MPAASGHSQEIVVAKSSVRLSHVATEKIVVIKVSIANSKSPFAKAVVVKVAESAMPSRVTYENAVRIKDPNASPRTAPIPASIASVMAIDEFSTLPTLIVSSRPAAPPALCRHDCRQRYQQKATGRDQ